MELAADEPRMVGELDDLDQRLIRRDAAENQPGAAELLAIRVVELVAVAMPFVDLALAVEPCRERVLAQHARVRAEPHGAALARHHVLALHEMNDRMRRAVVDL